MAASQMTPAEILELEERRLALEIQSCEFLLKSAELMRELAAEETDECHRLFLKDASRDLIRTYVSVLMGKRLVTEEGGLALNPHAPITIAEVAKSLGYAVTRQDLRRLRRAVTQAYRKTHAGQNPPKQKLYVDGVLRDFYYQKDRRFIEDAVLSYFM